MVCAASAGENVPFVASEVVVYLRFESSTLRLSPLPCIEKIPMASPASHTSSWARVCIPLVTCNGVRPAVVPFPFTSFSLPHPARTRAATQKGRIIPPPGLCRMKFFLFIFLLFLFYIISLCYAYSLCWGHALMDVYVSAVHHFPAFNDSPDSCLCGKLQGGV